MRNQEQETKLFSFKNKLKKEIFITHCFKRHRDENWEIKEASRFSENLNQYSPLGPIEMKAQYEMCTSTPQGYTEVSPRCSLGLFCDPLSWAGMAKSCLKGKQGGLWGIPWIMETHLHKTQQSCRPWRCKPLLPACSTARREWALQRVRKALK